MRSKHRIGVIMRIASVPQAITVSITCVWWVNEDGDLCQDFQNVKIDGVLPDGYTYADFCEDAADFLRS